MNLAVNIDGLTADSVIFVFTQQFPYGKGESFILNEINFLSTKFDHIIICPIKKINEEAMYQLPGNVSVKFHSDQPKKPFIQPSKKWKLLVKHFTNEKTFFKTIKNSRTIIARATQAIELANFIANNFSQNSTYYSYWFDEWALALSILKEKGAINNFFCRAHGYDIYSERWKDSCIPYRIFLLKSTEKLILPSVQAKEYMVANYNKFKQKFFVSRLGVFDKGVNLLTDSKKFVLVSCGWMNDVKRIDLIVDALVHTDLRINWVHFGDGERWEKVMDKVKHLPMNIEADLRGYCTPEQITFFYQTQQVNLFISVSKTEGGVPLSIQEAVSFGIPVLATDAGGTKEAVNGLSGKLVSVDITSVELALEIRTFVSGSMNTANFRSGVKDFWRKELNYTAQLNELSEHLKQ